MSTRTARRTAKSTDKPEAKKPKVDVKQNGNKSKTVTLEHKAEKVGSHQFTGKGLITGLYVKKPVIELLNEGKSVTLSFKLFDGDQPKHSVRFAEQGKEMAVGTLYLMRTEAAKVGITDKTKAVKARLSESNGKLRVTVQAV